VVKIRSVAMKKNSLTTAVVAGIAGVGVMVRESAKPCGPN
jgi:hypothetical protein